MTLVAAIRVSDACCWKPNGNQMETKCKPSGALSWKVSGRFRGTIDVPLLQPFGNPLHRFFLLRSLMAGRHAAVVPRSRSRSPQAIARTDSGEMTIQVRGLSGTIVASLKMHTHDRCRVLKHRISSAVGICACKLQLSAGLDLMRDDHNLHRYRKRLGPDNVVNLILQTIDAMSTSIAQLIQARVCFKCMKEAGASAEDILKHLVHNRLDIDARALRNAGFSLRELVQPREKNMYLFHFHPPVTTKTLFDSQLQQAGYSAEDFRNAGYLADQLIYDADYWADPKRTPGELEWEETHAFFSAEELKTAGWS